MGIVKGLAGINKQLEGNSFGGDGEERVKAKYLSLKDGQTVKGRFLQELDEGSVNYNDKVGVGFLAVQHQSPLDFKRNAQCTIDEEGCYGCERYSGGVAEFKQKHKLYINFLVQNPDGSSEVVVVSQGNGGKSITPQLLEMAGEYGTITNRQWKIKRTGSGKSNTSYTLTPMDKDDILYDVTQHEVFELEKVMFTVPYAQQERYYGYANKAADSSDELVSAGSVGDTEVW